MDSRTGLGWASIWQEKGWQGTGEGRIHFGEIYGVGKQWNAFVVGDGLGCIDNLDVIFCNWFLDMNKAEMCQFPQS